MKRRDFLKYVGASGCGPWPLARAAESQASRGGSARPNFLILMSDQHSPHVLGCYGDPVVRTPNLDALAERGVLFRNHYCSAPLCVPSRMAFLTGQQPSATRVWRNDDTLASDIPTFAHSLGASGYHTALIGRMHFNGMDQWHGFGKRLVGSLLPQYSYLKFPLSPELTPGAQGRSRRAVEIAGPGKTAYQAYDEDVTESAIQYLRGRSDSQGSPFCAVVGFVLPHPPFVCSRDQWEYYRDRVTIPEVPPGYFEHLHPAMQRWRQMHGVEDIKPDEVRKARAGYYGLVSELDARIGRILGELSRHSFARNTIVIYTSDHGEMAGENGIWWKMNFYQGSVSVPLIVSWPGKWAPGRSDRVTSMIDLAPSILNLAQAPALPEATGSSLEPLLGGGKVEWLDEAFSEYPPDLGVPAIRMIRSGRWKLVNFDGQRPQLFDLETDPHEFHDLGEDAACAQVRATLMSRALSGWSAAAVSQGAEVRLASDPIMHKWEMQVRPPATAQWEAPAGCNVFPEKA